MTGENDEARRARRYLLGEATDEERSALERRYFASEDAFERMEAAEEALVEDYIAERLSTDERRRFELEYLGTPHRRARVETTRALMLSSARAASVDAAGSRGAPAVARGRYVRALSLAAAATVVIAAGGWWILTSGGRSMLTNHDAVSHQVAPAPPAAPRVFAVSISPAAVRSAGGAAAILVPPGTDLIEIALEGAPGDVRAVRPSVVVRTVSGREVWRGEATTPSGLPADMAAQVDVPADRLPADDYVITLSSMTSAGVEQEMSQYFLRIRAR